VSCVKLNNVHKGMQQARALNPAGQFNQWGRQLQCSAHQQINPGRLSHLLTD
jgi:hypothetical protein